MARSRKRKRMDVTKPKRKKRARCWKCGEAATKTFTQPPLRSGEQLPAEQVCASCLFIRETQTAALRRLAAIDAKPIKTQADYEREEEQRNRRLGIYG